MRLAIFSDVHGNLTALQAVLAHIDSLEPAPDQVMFAGDLCFLGPSPEACLDIVRQRQFGSVHGNTDLQVLKPLQPPDDASEEDRRRWNLLREVGFWTQDRLGSMGLAWLESLPFHRRVSPSVNPHDDLLLVHANPHDVEGVIYPPESEQKERYDEVRQSDEALGRMLAGTVAGVIAFGHIHLPFVRHWHDLILANVSSVSKPLDGDPRAKYALLTWGEEDGWLVEHFRVPYPLEQEIALFESARPPGWQEEVENLRNLAK